MVFFIIIIDLSIFICSNNVAHSSHTRSRGVWSPLPGSVCVFPGRTVRLAACLRSGRASGPTPAAYLLLCCHISLQPPTRQHLWPKTTGNIKPQTVRGIASILYTCQVTLDISRSPIDFQWGSWKYPGQLDRYDTVTSQMTGSVDDD